MLRKKQYHIFWAFLLFILPDSLSAQGNYQQIYEVKVLKGQDTLAFPWMGGFNNVQMYNIDLDQDSKQDLVIFDRAGDKLLTFLNTGNTTSYNYRYAPQYEAAFPRLKNWIVIADFNCDGVPDIFTSNVSAVTVYRGVITGGELNFVLEQELLKYQENSVVSDLYVNPIDIPAIIDVNNDGDPDILTFAPGGGYMEYFENRSVENTGNCGQLSFELVDKCWGDFYESGLSKKVDLDSCGSNLWGGATEENRHAGSTVMAFDINNDGLKEVVLGDISFDNLNLLINGGTLNDAEIVAQDTAFPATQPANIPIFPAAFYLHINNDNANDLVIAPNAKNSSLDVSNIYFYENTGTTANPVFNFIKQDLLIENTIDVGTGSAPAFFDHNGDGLLDMVIGNESRQSGQQEQHASLTLYENIGTTEIPVFKWVTNDYAGLSMYNLFAITPAFGDLDGDGDVDMIIGNFDGSLHYFPNTAGASNVASFPGITPQYFGIDVGSFSTPQLIDVNRDGKLDLIVGEKNGNLNYFQNNGTATTPNFTTTPTNDFFGQVDVRPFANVIGYSSPYMYDNNGSYELLVGNIGGHIYRYTNIDNNLSGAFNRTDTIFAAVNAGERATLGGGNLNNNSSPEIIIGNLRGGVNLLSKDLMIGVADRPYHEKEINMYPNPASDHIYLDVSAFQYREGMLEIMDISGKKIYNTLLRQEGEIRISTEDWPQGIYFIHIYSGTVAVSKKLIILK